MTQPAHLLAIVRAESRVGLLSLARWRVPCRVLAGKDWLPEAIAMEDYTHLLVLDSTDVLCLGYPEEILGVFREFDRPWVIAPGGWAYLAERLYLASARCSTAPWLDRMGHLFQESTPEVGVVDDFLVNLATHTRPLILRGSVERYGSLALPTPGSLLAWSEDARAHAGEPGYRDHLESLFAERGGQAWLWELLVEELPDGFRALVDSLLWADRISAASQLRNRPGHVHFRADPPLDLMVLSDPWVGGGSLLRPGGYLVAPSPNLQPGPGYVRRLDVAGLSVYQRCW